MKIISSGVVKACFLIATLIICNTIMATPNDTIALSKSMWKDARSSFQSLSQSPVQAKIILAGRAISSPLQVRALELDEPGLKNLLTNQYPATAARVANSDNDSSLSDSMVIAIPLPTGGEVSLKVETSSVMAPELAQQFPELKTWKVTGIDQKIEGRIDFTTQGFHAMLLMPDGDTVFIEPDNETARTGQLSSQGSYMSFSKHSNHDNFKSDFKCAVHPDPTLGKSTFAKTPSVREQLLARPAPNSITYRLAVAATGEYTQFHGGTKSTALSAIVTTINRVNQLYERDLSISFQLIAQETDLIYTNPVTDPYTNSNISSLVDENISNLSNSGVLNTTLFDVGHVFGAGNVGGLAFVGSVCSNSFKAGGATGISSPLGDAFALDYVAHELGHQMGATHTFNSACGDGSERSAATAVEPGSGTTIMSYAGLCQNNNIQNSVDPQFHIVSITQIKGFSTTGGGNACATSQVVTNENPTIDAGLDFTIPARTPFVLTASGSDTDGDSLTYTWEQSNVGKVSDVDIDTAGNALFRSRLPSSSAVRYIPRLNDLFAGIPSRGERLPVTNRNIEFVATARDGKGGLQADLVNMSVFDTGESFKVTSHDSSDSFGIGTTKNATWNVAGTDVTPISCQEVDIGLVSSNGNNIFLLRTSNDGEQLITIPSEVSTLNNDVRLIISCSNGSFFNLSGNSDITSFLSKLENSGSGGSGGGGGGSIGYLIIPFFTLMFLRKKRFLVRN